MTSQTYAPRIENGRFMVEPSVNRMRTELHFGDRVIRCLTDRPQRFDDLLRRAEAEHPQAEALACGDARLSYAEFGAWADRIAFGLEAAGIGRGDRVGVFCGNGLPFFVAIMGIARRGAVAVPISAKASADDVAYILQNCEAAGLIREAELDARMPDRALLPALRRDWRIEGEPGALGSLPEEFPPVVAPYPVTGEEDDVVFLFYTSGTTGRPKGAAIANLNMCHSALHYGYAIDLRPFQRGLLAIPGSHISGFMALYGNMLASASATIMMRSFDTAGLIEIMAREKITYTVFVPTIYHLILMHRDFDPAKLKDWRYGIYGGGIMAPATILSLGEKLPELLLINAYGATETASPVSIMPAEASATRPASIGLLMQCAEALVMDDEGREVPPGGVGELWIKGPMVIPGYWNAPEQNAANFKDGYWKTGDVVSIDEEGYLFIHDRKKDMINRGGYKVFSAELENAALALPGVMEAAAVAVQDPVMGERACLCLRLSEDGPDEASLRASLNQRLSDYKRPDFYLLSTDPLPRNANGKIVKAHLVEAARQFEGQHPK